MLPDPKKSISVLLPLKYYTPLKNLAEESNYSMSAYLRQLIRRHLHHVEQRPEDATDWWQANQ